MITLVGDLDVLMPYQQYCYKQFRPTNTRVETYSCIEITVGKTCSLDL